MREILFRAKAIKYKWDSKKKEHIAERSKNWIFGKLLTDNRIITVPDETVESMSCFDMCDYQEPIDRETLGQYTGLKDKNGKKVFVGDVVIVHYFFQNYDPITLGAFEDEDEITGKIIFDLDGFRVVDRKDECRQLPLSMIQEPVEELEVIGNIYDNPELLKGENLYD